MVKSLKEMMAKDDYYCEWHARTGRHIQAKNRAIQWAKEVLENKKDWVILDTETTGLYHAEIVQIGICDLDGNPILDSLVRPTVAISSAAFKVHGIHDDIVRTAPNFPQTYPKIVAALRNKKVIIYNANYDNKVIDHCQNLHELESLGLNQRSKCLMRWYAQFCGEWSDQYDSYKWQPLNGNHTAIGDCLAALKILKIIAQTKTTDTKQSFLSAWQIYTYRFQ